jgi:chloramphenicol 3-O-phosphotransferase
MSARVIYPPSCNGSRKVAVNERTSPCPCGCGAELIGMVVEREAGLRADAAQAAARQPVGQRDGSGIFLITGMPGAGKSTVSRALAQRFGRSAHIDIDMVFHHFTVTGKADPAKQDAEAAAQAMLAVRNAAVMARNYADAGFTCVLDGAVAERAQVMACAQAVYPHRLHLVVLAPPVQVSDERDAGRSGKTVAAFFRHLHPLLHEQLAGLGLWLDTSQQTPAESVTTILNLEDKAILALG